MEKQNIVCIFAHPDDEAFGPGGIIANWSQKNNVYIICVTDGSHPNSGNKDLANIRSSELKSSAKILGVKKIFCLNYCDGELNNNCYHEVADKIKAILLKLKPSILLTFEMRGVSGHIDHMFVSMVTTFLFQRLEFVKKLFYFVNPSSISSKMTEYFIYFPDGYDKSEVDYIEDINRVWDKKVASIRAHVSQKSDGNMFLQMLQEIPREEMFFVKSKTS